MARARVLLCLERRHKDSHFRTPSEKTKATRPEVLYCTCVQLENSYVYDGEPATGLTVLYCSNNTRASLAGYSSLVASHLASFYYEYEYL